MLEYLDVYEKQFGQTAFDDSLKQQELVEKFWVPTDSNRGESEVVHQVWYVVFNLLLSSMKATCI